MDTPIDSCEVLYEVGDELIDSLMDEMDILYTEEAIDGQIQSE